MGKMIANRVEKHVIKENDKYYPMLCDFMHKSTNLYNHANYIVRNEFVKNGKWIRYAELEKILRADQEYDDYRQMPFFCQDGKKQKRHSEESLF